MRVISHSTHMAFALTCFDIITAINRQAFAHLDPNVIVFKQVA